MAELLGAGAPLEVELLGFHCGLVVSNVASQQEGPFVGNWLRPFCSFVCLPWVCEHFSECHLEWHAASVGSSKLPEFRGHINCLSVRWDKESLPLTPYRISAWQEGMNGCLPDLCPPG